MRRLLATMMAAALLAPFFGSAPVHASGLATLGVSLSSSSIAVGDTLTAKVWVNPNGEAIDTVRVLLTYDPAVLEATWFDIGTAFPSLSPEYEIDNDAGTVNVGAFRYGERVTDSAVALTVQFTAKAVGTSSVAVDDASRLIYDGEEMIDVAGTETVGTKTVSVGGASAAAPAPTTDKSLEETALIYFGAFAGRMPSSAVDWEALHCMAYDTCYPADVADRNVAHEQQSLVVFGAKYGHIPVTAADWRALHAIAYTEIFYDWTAIDAAS